MQWEERKHEGLGDVYRYDGLNRLVDTTRNTTDVVAEHATPGSTTYGYRRAFDLDGDHHRKSVSTTPSGGTAAVTSYVTAARRHYYDSIHYAGDPSPTQRTFSPDGRILTHGSREFHYDAADNLTFACDGTVLCGKYEYDALGRRITKLDGDGNFVRYVYAGPWILEEWDGASPASSRTAVHFHGVGIDDVVMSRRVVPDGSGGTVENDYWLHRNKLGSVMEVTDDTGSIVESYRYEAFGKPEVFDALGQPIVDAAGTPVSAIGNTYMFTGREWDSETGYYYLRARTYDPDSGTFLQEDPLGLLDGLNPVAYVKGSPTAMTDPTGTSGLSDMISEVTDFINDNKGLIADLLMDLAGPLEAIFDLISSVTGKDYSGWIRGGLQGEPGSMGWWSRAVAAASAAVTLAVGVVKIIGKLKGIFGKMKDLVNKARSGAKKGGRCFVFGTLVCLSTGEFVPIEDVKPGDMVETFEPSALPGQEGRAGDHEVTDVFLSDYEGALHTIEVTSGDGAVHSLSGTPEHPIWSPGTCDWVPLSALAIGDSVQALGGVAQVSGHSVAFGEFQVANLSIRGPHTYRVTAARMVVHNGCGAQGAPTRAKATRKKPFHYIVAKDKRTARQIAKNLSGKGKVPVIHRNPRKGPQHYHPVNGRGKKMHVHVTWKNAPVPGGSLTRSP